MFGAINTLNMPKTPCRIVCRVQNKSFVQTWSITWTTVVWKESQAGQIFRHIPHIVFFFFVFFIVLGFNDISTLVGHFVSSLREREKRDRRRIVQEMKGRDRGERKMNESEETDEIKTPPPTLTCCKDSRPSPTVVQYQLDAPATWDTRHICLFTLSSGTDRPEQTVLIRIKSYKMQCLFRV